MKAILIQIFGQRISCFALHSPTAEIFTRLSEALSSWMIRGYNHRCCYDQTRITIGNITELRLCRSERIRTKCLTKNGACGCEQMETMKNSVYKLADMEVV